MKLIIFFVTVVFSSASILTGCDKAVQDAQQVQKQRQQEAADREAMSGQFKKSPGKSY